MSWLFLATTVAGGAGAAARFVVDGWVTRASSAKVPVGTVVINVTGSFALGIIAMIAAEGLLPPPAQTIAASGFLAGYTTFSTASAQTSDLVAEGRHGAAALYSGGMFAGSLVAAAIGMWCASLLG
ncbi:fluoride efflux transporter FluC [Microbacterium timonense]|uniref:fluoride efflux transporter FluC n=1 Tax=Microbacterium timonense TaxID=2086576 RepID=UPI000D0E51BF|nr:CrcB family protein [Microbacterium timonense]